MSERDKCSESKESKDPWSFVKRWGQHDTSPPSSFNPWEFRLGLFGIFLTFHARQITDTLKAACYFISGIDLNFDTYLGGQADMFVSKEQDFGDTHRHITIHFNHRETKYSFTLTFKHTEKMYESLTCNFGWGRLNFKFDLLNQTFEVIEDGKAPELFDISFGSKLDLDGIARKHYIENVRGFLFQIKHCLYREYTHGCR